MRRCAICDGSIEGRRADTRTCSNKCRTAAWRSRATSAGANADRDSSKSFVTVRGPLVTPTAFVGGPCRDAGRCRHYRRFASGPWTCEYCHPRAHGEWAEAA
jgi:hypothetical protein